MKRLNSVPTVILSLTASIIILVSFLLTAGCSHPGPYFPIENQFDQPVTIYFNGVKVGTIKPGAARTFYPNEVLTKTDTNLLLEAKSNSGNLLYSRDFTWSQLSEVIEGLHGKTNYKISPGYE
jgi:hypothetical protein